MEPFEIYQQIRESEGDRIFWRMRELHAVYKIFSGNLEELLTVLQKFGNHAIAEPIMSDDQKRQQFLLLVFRLLHNFLASAATLTDYTRILNNDLYPGKPFGEEFRDRVNQDFAEAGIPRFVKDLRNWMVHRADVPLEIVKAFQPDGSSKSRLKLTLRRLSEWDGWSSRARSLLNEAPGDIILEDLVQDYGVTVDRFYSWLECRMLEVHADDLRHTEELRTQYAVARSRS